MATAAAVLNNFSSDSWKAELYESLSLAARLSTAVKSMRSHGQNIKISYWLWKVNGTAGKFFSEVEDIISGKAKPENASTVPPTEESIQDSINTLMRIGNSLNEVYEEARRRRLMNNSLIAGPVTALRANADQFFELAEWFDLVKNAEHVEDIFANAREQRSRGEVYDLSQV